MSLFSFEDEFVQFHTDNHTDTEDTADSD
jgi:hypothetical protein